MSTQIIILLLYILGYVIGDQGTTLYGLYTHKMTEANPLMRIIYTKHLLSGIIIITIIKFSLGIAFYFSNSMLFFVITLAGLLVTIHNIRIIYNHNYLQFVLKYY